MFLLKTPYTCAFSRVEKKLSGFASEAGQDLVEYSLLLGLLAISSAAVLVSIGNDSKGVWSYNDQMLSQASTAAQVSTGGGGGGARGSGTPGGFGNGVGNSGNGTGTGVGNGNSFGNGNGNGLGVGNGNGAGNGAGNGNSAGGNNKNK